MKLVLNAILMSFLSLLFGACSAVTPLQGEDRSSQLPLIDLRLDVDGVPGGGFVAVRGTSGEGKDEQVLDGSEVVQLKNGTQINGPADLALDFQVRQLQLAVGLAMVEETFTLDGFVGLERTFTKVNIVTGGPPNDQTAESTGLLLGLRLDYPFQSHWNFDMRATVGVPLGDDIATQTVSLLLAFRPLEHLRLQAGFIDIETVETTVGSDVELAVGGLAFGLALDL